MNIYDYLPWDRDSNENWKLVSFFDNLEDALTVLVISGVINRKVNIEGEGVVTNTLLKIKLLDELLSSNLISYSADTPYLERSREFWNVLYASDYYYKKFEYHDDNAELRSKISLAEESSDILALANKITLLSHSRDNFQSVRGVISDTADLIYGIMHESTPVRSNENKFIRLQTDKTEIVVKEDL